MLRRPPRLFARAVDESALEAHAHQPSLHLLLGHTLVMYIELSAQFVRLFFRRSVTQEISTADFRSGQVLQQVRLSQGRVKLYMKMETTVVAAIHRSLVQWHDIGEGHLPKIIKLDQDFFEHFSKVAHLAIRKPGYVRMGGLRRHKDLIG